MALVSTTPTAPVSPNPQSLVSPFLIGVPAPGFKLSLLTFGIGFVITPALPGTTIAGRSFADFPLTPKAPEPWVLGCVQNVIKQSVTITWLDDSGGEQSETLSTGQMLDADPDPQSGGMQHLPFVRVSNGSGLAPATMGLLYGLPGAPAMGVPALPPKGPGPAWDITTAGTGPFTIIATDAPTIFVFAFKGGGAVSGSSNPIIEVHRSITLQVWLTAVRVTEIRNSSKHNVIGYTDEFTLEGKFDRRPAGNGDPSSAGWFHFDKSDFTIDAITPKSNPGNSAPPRRRPIVTGQLSDTPVKQFLINKGFAA